MIIVIGFDNTGKTTLTSKLQNDLDLERVTSKGIRSKDEQRLWALEQLHGDHSKKVYDRFTPFEEMVYGPILRKESNFSFDDPIITELKQDVRPQIIYCRPHSDIIFGTLNDREQMEGVDQFRTQLLQAYDNIAFKLLSDNWMIQVYDWTRSNAYDDILEIHKWMGELFNGQTGNNLQQTDGAN